MRSGTADCVGCLCPSLVSTPNDTWRGLRSVRRGEMPCSNPCPFWIVCGRDAPNDNSGCQESRPDTALIGRCAELRGAWVQGAGTSETYGGPWHSARPRVRLKKGNTTRDR